jgi:DNA invertase Pin-like site-specific DNA recombinase
VLEFLHAGDVLMVTRIDRLARSIGDLQDIVRTVRARGRAARLRSMTDAIEINLGRKPSSYGRLRQRVVYAGLRGFWR